MFSYWMHPITYHNHLASLLLTLAVLLQTSCYAFDSTFTLPYDQDTVFTIVSEESNKPFEGPINHESAVGGSLSMPCLASEFSRKLAEKRRKKAIARNRPWAIAWVHGDWDKVVDPWRGDGRRVYNPFIVYPKKNGPLASDDPVTDSNFEPTSTALLLTGAQPIDSGIYACLMVTYSFEKSGYSPIDLSKAELISLHVVRIRPGNVIAGLCTHETDNVNELGHQMCQTGLEDWTTSVYTTRNGKTTGETIYQIKCETEVFLTALIMAKVDPMFWSIGWRFIPEGQQDIATRVLHINISYTSDADKDTTWDMQAPTDGCFVDTDYSGDASRKYFTPNDESCPMRLRKRLYDTSNVLTLAAGQAAKWWRATWLAVYAGRESQSGTWQCWVQGLVSVHNGTKQSSFNAANLVDEDDDGRDESAATTSDGRSTVVNAYARWFVKEVYIEELQLPLGFEYWHTNHIWRIVGLLAAPLMVILIGLIFLTGTVAFIIYADSTAKLEQSTVPPQYQTITSEEMQKWKNQLIEPMTYIYRYLRKHNVKTYDEIDEETLAE